MYIQPARLVLLLLMVFLTTACKVENDPRPVVENNPEAMNTMYVTLTELSGTTYQGGTTYRYTYTFQDLDGSGGQEPYVHSIELKANKTYNLSISLLNKDGESVLNLSKEIFKEWFDHEFFFVPSEGLQLSAAANTNTALYPYGVYYVGVQKRYTSYFTLKTMSPSTGTFKIILKHQFDLKRNTYDINSGVTDIEAIFPVTVK